MDYNLKYNHFHILRNYIVKDPICDWFEINKHKYIQDENTYYKDYIRKESKHYKLSVLKKIKELSRLNIPLNPTFNQTKELIYNDSELIFQGILLNKDGYYVNCDLIITYRLFKKIFPEINNIPFHLYYKYDTDYLLIDICYHTLHFKADLKEVQNDDNIFYKKCHISSFQEVFFELSGKYSHCFLLGKEYYYKKTLLPKKEFISEIVVDKNMKNTVKNAMKWIKTLKHEFNMNIYPKPTHIELYPNMNVDSYWEDEKKKLAEEIKEITLVWNLSYDERCEFIKKNIYCWDDPKLLKQLKETKKKDIQERMIHMNQQDEVLIYPRKNISHNFKEILKRSEYDIYFDVESFLSFDEKQNLFPKKEKIETPILGILGYIHNSSFCDITINRYTKSDEERMIRQFSSQLYKIVSKEKNTINIYHWGHAENNYFQYIHKTYPKIHFPEYRLINILDYFRMEPIIVQGIFKFGLKSVGKALYNHGLINTTWGENDNGLESMIQFKQICKNNNKQIPLKRYLEIKNIIEYNRIDCQVLYEIVELLREKY